MITIAALTAAAVLVWAATQIASELKASRADAARARAVALMQLFAPGVDASAHDPRALLVWHPLATIGRQICPDEFAALDRAAGGTFPFTKEQLQAAHAEWTADWLAWERAHDAEFKLKAAEAERDVEERGGGPVERARLDSIEREKLALYQRRYEEYIRVGKALQALIESHPR